MKLYNQLVLKYQLDFETVLISSGSSDSESISECEFETTDNK